MFRDLPIHRPHNQELTPPDAVSVDLRADFNGSNWWSAEADGRWAGPEIESTVEIPTLSPGRYQLCLDVVDEIAPSIIDGTICTFDRQPVALYREGTGVPTVLRAEIEVSTAYLLHVIQLRFPEVHAPAEFGSADSRLLSLRLRRLWLTRIGDATTDPASASVHSGLSNRGAPALNSSQQAARKALAAAALDTPSKRNLLSSVSWDDNIEDLFTLNQRLAAPPGGVSIAFAAYAPWHFRAMQQLEASAAQPLAPLLPGIDPIRGTPSWALEFANERPGALYRLLRNQLARLQGVDCVIFFDCSSTVSRMLRRALSDVGVCCILLDLLDELSIDMEGKWGFQGIAARGDVAEALSTQRVPVLPLASIDISSVTAHIEVGSTSLMKAAGLDSERITLGLYLEQRQASDGMHELVRVFIEHAQMSRQAVISVDEAFFKSLPLGLSVQALNTPSLYLDVGHKLFPPSGLGNACNLLVTNSIEAVQCLHAMGAASRVIFVGDASTLRVPARTLCFIAEKSAQAVTAIKAFLQTQFVARDLANDAPPMLAPADWGDQLLEFAARVAGTKLTDAEAWMTPFSEFERHLLRGGDLDVLCLGINSGDSAARTSQLHLLDSLGARSRAQTSESIWHASAFSDVEVFCQWGLATSTTANNARSLARHLGAPMVILEDGLIRSVAIGLSGDPGLSLLLDTRTAYFDATRASLMEAVLNSDFELSEAQRQEARRLMDQIVSRRISKYNHAPDMPVRFGRQGRPKILLIDQRHGDVSIRMGLGREELFAEVLWGLISSRPDADIIIKRHPDALSKIKGSCFGDDVVAPARFMKQVTLVDYDINPFALMDAVDEVHVVTSGFGFEAVLAGKPVHCHGAPFYSGWGFTTDHMSHPRRRRRRTPEEVFHVAYLMLSRYYSPTLGRRCSLEELLDHIQQKRDIPRFVETPRAPLALPEGASLEDRIAAYQQSLEPQAIAAGGDVLLFNMSKWKHGFTRQIFGSRTLKFVDPGEPVAGVEEAIEQVANPSLVVWGRALPPGLESLSARRRTPILRLEDGFVRSVGLGANYVLPYSHCLDHRGIYFDATCESDLEHILATYDFRADEQLMQEARECREFLVANDLSKYNFPLSEQPASPYGPKTRERILVIGQVENDASILYGAPKGITNNDLVRVARAAHPDAQIVYKIHPDVLADKRASFSDPTEVAHLCEISSSTMTIGRSLEGVDRVYVMTSLAGFEALIRGVPVTTLGMPFYAGWGLTTDRMECSRRRRILTVDEVFAGAYLLYPRYADPHTGERMSLRSVMSTLLQQMGRATGKQAERMA